MNILYLEDKVKGTIFLIGGISLLLFTFNILVKVTSLILMAFAVFIIIKGLFKSNIIETLKRSQQQNQELSLDVCKMEKEPLKGIMMFFTGVILFLFFLGALDKLFYLILMAIAILFIVYGLKKTDLIKIIKDKVREQENKNSQQ